MQKKPEQRHVSRFGPQVVRGLLACASLGLVGTACTSAVAPKPGDDPVFSEPGLRITATEAVPADLRASLQEAEALDGAGIRAAYPASAHEPLSYDPTAAEGLALIQSSSYALDDAALSILKEQGVAISSTQFPSFAYGYKSIYSADLPVYVSADSILEAIHRTTDSFLSMAETQSLAPELISLLEKMLSRMPRIESEQTRRDADVYLSVALGLLRGEFVAPKASADGELAKSLFALAEKGEGTATVTLFGSIRTEDFSQFKPRGHYTDSEALSRYFRAMMWLGRTQLRIVETEENGDQVFRRRQFDAAVAMNELLGSDGLERWGVIDHTIGAFAGEHDNMTPLDMTAMLEALGVSNLKEELKLKDDAIVDALVSGGFGAQRIASRLIENDSEDKTLPLDRVYLLFGQRFTADSFTFTATTYDRIPERVLPNPVEVPFSVLGNNAALGFLEDDLKQDAFAGALAKTRTLIDAHGADYFEGSLYTRWLGALRAISTLPEGAALPRTEGFDAKVLNSQLGSWAQLRHDTILYVKQSYTTGSLCEFPDAYVDPYPEFYARLDAYAAELVDVVAQLPGATSGLGAAAVEWAKTFRPVVQNLQKMAENELTGAENSPELIEFINSAVNWEEEIAGCGGELSYTNLTGWYHKLYVGSAAIEYDPTVADVHTDLLNSGKILHVGTEHPRFTVVTADTCSGPRAYAGLTYGYAESLQETRLTDNEWSALVADGGVTRPKFLAKIATK